MGGGSNPARIMRQGNILVDEEIFGGIERSGGRCSNERQGACLGLL